jgi:hypothetical protein
MTFSWKVKIKEIYFEIFQKVRKNISFYTIRLKIVCQIDYTFVCQWHEVANYIYLQLLKFKLKDRIRTEVLALHTN